VIITTAGEFVASAHERDEEWFARREEEVRAETANH
jgi:hypothetical protein